MPPAPVALAAEAGTLEQDPSVAELQDDVIAALAQVRHLHRSYMPCGVLLVHHTACASMTQVKSLRHDRQPAHEHPPGQSADNMMLQMPLLYVQGTAALSAGGRD